MRDRLIELLQKVRFDNSEKEATIEEQIADHLINNGVIIPPCKVGDRVYEIVCDDPFFEDSILRVVESTVCEFVIYTTEEMHNMKSVGKTYFLSREEAEKKLEGLRGGENEKQ